MDSRFRGNDTEDCCHPRESGACAIALRIAAEVENATIVFVVCDRGDRYLSTGLFG